MGYDMYFLLMCVMYVVDTILDELPLFDGEGCW